MGGYLLLLLIFPGLVFQISCGLIFEWLDRKILARFQRRVGPRLYQPLADLIKLCRKEDIVPAGASRLLAGFLPLISFAAVLTAGMSIPIAGFVRVPFEGDLIVILFLLSVPSLAYYLAGVGSVGIYSLLGGGRSLLQYLSYEVPLIIALSGPAILGGSWSVQRLIDNQNEMGAFIFYQPLGLILALVGLIGKLKRDPLDIPKAKSEIVAGPLTEYTGLKLAFWHLVMNIQAVLGIFLIVNLFFGAFIALTSWISGLNFFLISLMMILILSATSAIFARLRIDQLAGLGWKILVPLGLIQLFFVLLMRI